MSAACASSTVSPSTSSLVFSVTNVYQQFGFKLSIDGTRYKLWRQIFNDLCVGAKALDHLKGLSLPTDANDTNWYALDAKIKGWIYNTCVDNNNQ